MLRRRIFAYAVMMIAGVASGYFILERLRIFRGLLVLAAVAAVICLGAARRYYTVRDRRILTAWLALGFVLFAARYLHYEAACDLIATDGEDVTCTLTGEIISMKERGEGFRMTVDVRGVGRVQADYYGYRDEAEDMNGRRAVLRGILRIPQQADNPGCFDYRTYLRSNGIRYQLKCTGIGPAGAGLSLRGRLKRLMARERDSFLELFTDDEKRAFIKGVIFGDKSEIDEDTLEDFSINATGHILAVSGLHMGFLYALLKVLSGRKRTLAHSLALIAVLWLTER